MPGGQLSLVAAGLVAAGLVAAGLVATLLPPPLVQADVAEPSTMVAKMPIAAGTLVMIVGFSSSAATTIAFARVGFVAGVFTSS